MYHLSISQRFAKVSMLSAFALTSALCFILPVHAEETKAAVEAPAEKTTVVFAFQNGWAYTPLRVMDDQDLVEKHAKKLGIVLKAEYKNLGSPGVIRDAMLSGDVQFGAVGVPTLIMLADKTKGEWKAVGNIVSVPMFLNTSGSAKTICDIEGKIALPTIKSSVQATTLQMAAKKQCKDNPFFLDSKTVSMPHPDGYIALLNGQVEAHFTSPPFNQLEIKNGKEKNVRTIASSYDILGGKTSFILLIGSDKWREANPKDYEAISDAFEEAILWTRNNPKEAAKLYVEKEKSKETVDEVERQMMDESTLFDTTPNHIGTYSSFMKDIGTVKNTMDWKYLSMPNLQKRKGS